MTFFLNKCKKRIQTLYRPHRPGEVFDYWKKVDIKVIICLPRLLGIVRWLWQRRCDDGGGWGCDEHCTALRSQILPRSERRADYMLLKHAFKLPKDCVHRKLHLIFGAVISIQPERQREKVGSLVGPVRIIRSFSSPYALKKLHLTKGTWPRGWEVLFKPTVCTVWVGLKCVTVS